MNQYEGIVKSVAYKYRAIAEQEDLEQEIRIAIWKGLDNYDTSQGTSESTYAYNLAKWRCGKLRSVANRTKRSAHVVSGDTPLSTDGDGATIFDTIAGHDPRPLEGMRETIAALPDEKTRAIAQMLVAGFTTREIAEKLDVSPQTVLNRAKTVEREFQCQGCARMMTGAKRKFCVGCPNRKRVTVPRSAEERARRNELDRARRQRKVT